MPTFGLTRSSGLSLPADRSMSEAAYEKLVRDFEHRRVVIRSGLNSYVYVHAYDLIYKYHVVGFYQQTRDQWELYAVDWSDLKTTFNWTFDYRESKIARQVFSMFFGGILT